MKTGVNSLLYKGTLGPTRRLLEIDGSENHVNMGIINIRTKEVVSNFRIGEPAPELIVSDARGIDSNVKIKDFKGKWLLIDFWGHWCGPCIRKMPKLMEFYEKQKGNRDRFEILAFHSPDAKDFKIIDEKMPIIYKRFFGGKEIPFPIVLDASGETVKNYRVRAFPTTILINPEGKIEVVGKQALHTLGQKLGLAEKKPNVESK